MKRTSRMLSLALLLLGLMALVWACAPAEEPIAVETVELEPQPKVDAAPVMPSPASRALSA